MATALAALRPPPWLGRWWASKTRTERRVVSGFALLVAVACAWLVVWQPMQRDVVELRAAAPLERAALANAQRMTDEIAGLARPASAPAAADPRAALERVLAERGLRSAATQLDWQEGRVRVTFTSVRLDALIAALDELQRDARLRVVEATFTARVDPGTVRADLVLAP